MHRRQKRTSPALSITIAAVIAAVFAISFLTNGPATVLWPLQVPAILWVVEHGPAIVAVILGWVVLSLAAVGAWAVTFGRSRRGQRGRKVAPPVTHVTREPEQVR